MKTDTRKALQLLVDFIDDIAPQLGKLCIQDIAGLSEGLRLARKALLRDSVVWARTTEPGKCACIYATAKNSKSVREGFEVGGYLVKECDFCRGKRNERPV